MPRSTTLHLLPVPTALEAIGEQLAEQQAANQKIGEELGGIRNALERMNDRIQKHDEFRAKLSKYIGAVMTPIAVALILYLARLAWVVQINRVISP